MRIIKSDRRHKLFNQGFTHILEFRAFMEQSQFNSIASGLEKTYGPAETTDYRNAWIHRTLNHNYRLELNRKTKRRRIYLRNEKDVTMFILKGQL